VNPVIGNKNAVARRHFIILGHRAIEVSDFILNGCLCSLTNGVRSYLVYFGKDISSLRQLNIGKVPRNCDHISPSAKFWYFNLAYKAQSGQNITN
jgi:hypothetical protein